MRGLLRFVVIAFTLITVMLVAAVGVSAGSGTFGSSHAAKTVVHLMLGHSEDNHGNGNGDGCHEKNHNQHHDATGGHENDCDGDDDTE